MVLLLLDNETLPDMILSLSEVHSRNAFTIVITDCLWKLEMAKIDLAVELVPSQDLTPLVAVVAFQLISLHVALLKGLNPDKPRNLAKTVTVG